MQNNSTERKAVRGKPPQITAKTKVYIVIIAWVLAAVKTIIPFPYVSKACMLGYKAGCSFAPISTLILVAGAVVTYFVAKKKNIL
jgi:hypothetical protein